MGQDEPYAGAWIQTNRTTTYKSARATNYKQAPRELTFVA